MNEQLTEAVIAPAAAPAAPKAKAKAKAVKKSAAPKVKKAKKATKKSEAKSVASIEKKGPEVLRDYVAKYVKDTEKKTAGGHTSVDCADATADKLRGKDLDTVYVVAAKATGETEKELRTRYKHLNPGMQRMTLGNKIRAAVGAR